MPIYDFKNKETDEVIEVNVKIADYDNFLKDNPHLTRHFTSTPALVSAGKSTLSTAGDGWKDHLNRIKKGSGRGNTIKT